MIIRRLILMRKCGIEIAYSPTYQHMNSGKAQHINRHYKGENRQSGRNGCVGGGNGLTLAEEGGHNKNSGCHKGCHQIDCNVQTAVWGTDLAETCVGVG